MFRTLLFVSIAVTVLAGCAAPSISTARSGSRAQDDRIAVLRKEADGGSVVAGYRLFLLSAQRDAVAMKYLRLAADGYVPAMSALGVILLESQSAAERAEGEKYLRMAALHGDVDAKKFLELRGIAW